LQWADLIRRAIPLIKFAVAVVIGYKVLNGISYFQLAEKVVSMLPHPHPMDEKETAQWFDRAKGNVD
jgi:hypothetical protein